MHLNDIWQLNRELYVSFCFMFSRILFVDCQSVGSLPIVQRTLLSLFNSHTYYKFMQQFHCVFISFRKISLVLYFIYISCCDWVVTVWQSFLIQLYLLAIYIVTFETRSVILTNFEETKGESLPMKGELIKRSSYILDRGKILRIHETIRSIVINFSIATQIEYVDVVYSNSDGIAQ